MNIQEQRYDLSFKDQLMQLKELIAAGTPDRPYMLDVHESLNHMTLSRLFYEFTYEEAYKFSPARVVRMCYNDGSLGDSVTLQALPVRVLPRSSPLHDMRPLRAALISMRHRDLDVLVDLAWLLNSEVARCASSAEVEHFAYAQTLLHLADGLNNRALRLHLYQTGYQPAIVGFYRALIEVLYARKDKTPLLEVVPVYFSQFWNEYFYGREWH